MIANFILVYGKKHSSLSLANFSAWKNSIYKQNFNFNIINEQCL